MAVTQNTYTGDGTTVLFSFTFPYLETTDIKVSLNGTITTAYTLANATTIQFNTAPANGAAIRIYRQTDDAALAATFYPGSAIRSQDLNDNFTQNLYVTQEVNNNAVNIDGSNPMTGNLNLNNFKVVNLATPTVSTDASTKGYVDSVVATGAANAAAASASASSAASSATAAAIALDTFDDRYLGTKASDPLVDNDGNALIPGAMYFNTTVNRTRVYNGIIWAESGVPSSLARWTKTAVGGETSLSGNDNYGYALNYTPGSEQVFRNGTLLVRAVNYTATTGNTITGLTALTAGDVIQVLSFNDYVVGTVPDQSVTDAKVNISANIATSKLNYTPTGTGATSRTVDLKLGDIVSVKDFGAVGNGIANDTAAIQAALTASRRVFFPPGTYVVDGLNINITNSTLIGSGFRNTVLKVSTVAPSFGISMAAFQVTISDLEIQGDGTKNLMQTTGNCYAAKFNRVRFQSAAIGLQISHDFFWSTFESCYWRDCNTGVFGNVGQDLNAVTFSACTFHHFAPLAPTTNDCLDIINSDGITLLGCQAQNQGVKFTNCSKISIFGGYWECYDRPAFNLVNSTVEFNGISLLSASQVSIDTASAASIQGVFPDFVSSTVAGGRAVVNSLPIYCSVDGQITNYFPDPTCSTIESTKALTYSPTGNAATPALNVDGHVEFTMLSASTQRNGYRLGVKGSYYIKYKVTAGTARIRCAGSASKLVDVDSTTNSDWNYYRANDPSAVYFQPITASATVVIDEFIAASGTSFITGISQLTLPSVTQNPLIIGASRLGTKSLPSAGSGVATTVLSTPIPVDETNVIEVLVSAVGGLGNTTRTARFLWQTNGQAGVNTRNVLRESITLSSDLIPGNRTFTDITATAIVSGTNEVLQITATHGGVIPFTATLYVAYREIMGNAVT